jgi:hypothetical protein
MEFAARCSPWPCVNSTAPSSASAQAPRPAPVRASASSAGPATTNGVRRSTKSSYRVAPGAG